MAQLESMRLIALTKAKYRNKLGKIGNNTYARYDPENRVASVFLHGNLIAVLAYGDEKDSQAPFQTVFVTDADWGTPTTRDRINQLLWDNEIRFRCHQKNHTQYLTPLPFDFEKPLENFWQVDSIGYSSTRFANFVKQTPDSDWKFTSIV